MIYKAIDIFFTVFHTTLILFNLFGWIWKKTRLLNLAVLLLTGGSWLLLGALVGTPGYCPLTDWHFSILYKLGYKNLPSSYIKYLADRITGLDFDPHLADNLTLILFIAALILSAILNFRDITSVRKHGKLKGN